MYHFSKLKDYPSISAIIQEILHPSIELEMIVENRNGEINIPKLHHHGIKHKYPD